MSHHTGLHSASCYASVQDGEENGISAAQRYPARPDADRAALVVLHRRGHRGRDRRLVLRRRALRRRAQEGGGVMGALDRLFHYYQQFHRLPFLARRAVLFLFFVGCFVAAVKIRPFRPPLAFLLLLPPWFGLLSSSA